MQRFGLVTLAVLTACHGKPAREAELPGCYSMNSGDAKDVLVICPDFR